MRRQLDRLTTFLRWLPLLTAALFWVMVAWFWLTFRTYRSLRPKFFAPGMTDENQTGTWRVERVAWAVHHASRLVPRATCLTQALAAQIMLARRGFSSTVHIGVKRDDTTAFEAHAWLTFRDVVILGDRVRLTERYAQLAEYGPTAA